MRNIFTALHKDSQYLNCLLKLNEQQNQIANRQPSMALLHTNSLLKQQITFRIRPIVFFPAEQNSSVR